jgi:hypothetical protein
MPRPKERDLFRLYLADDGCLEVSVNMPPDLATNFRSEQHMVNVGAAIAAVLPFLDMLLGGIRERLPPPEPLPQDDLRQKMHAELDAFLKLLHAQRADGELVLRVRLHEGDVACWSADPPTPRHRGWRRGRRNPLTSTEA